jgi:hypothetical protein
MGSSGIRSGTSASYTVTRTEFDYLGEWWAKHSLAGVEDATITALLDLPRSAEFPQDCLKLGGGFSAWRLATQANVADLADILARIYKATGVPVVVVPQSREGAYGYFGSRRLLGKRLTTTHVLDIGGGSLQVSGERTSYGDALGQKIWHRILCQEIRKTESVPCTLQPMSTDELVVARTLLAGRLKPLRGSLPEEVTLTTISRPISRGVFPVLKKLAAEGVSTRGFSHSAITYSIDHLATITLDETKALFEIRPSYTNYLISDMLLMEGVLRATGGSHVNVADIDLTNIPGLLNDDHAFDWGQRYSCYLERLRSVGVRAYEDEPDCK